MPSSDPSGIVTFTTDFGSKDHYVGTMKGVVLQRCRAVHLVDISHGITPFSILQGAYTIAQAVPYFPQGTIHVIVIDPGVGSSRRALVAEAAQQVFVAPDNGVLGLVFAKTKPTAVFELNNPNWFLPEVSATFHGRDVFAAAAGHIVAGKGKLSEAGPPSDNWVELAKINPIRCNRGRWQGSILSIDHFGNIVTNFAQKDWPELATKFLRLNIGEHRVERIQRTFSEADDLGCFVYCGSSGYLEVGKNQARASDALGAVIGGDVILEVRSM